jgi:hypothetical protein
MSKSNGFIATAKARYLVRYSFVMKKLLDYKRRLDEEFVGIHPQSYWLVNEGEHSEYLHAIQRNITWVVQKIAELEKLQVYNLFRSYQLDALLQDDDVKERLGNV